MLCLPHLLKLCVPVKSIYGFSSETLRLKEEEPKRPPIMVQVKIENKTVSMELDTGGTVSVMCIKKFREISDKKIQPTNLVFKTYRGDRIVPLGYVTVKVEYRSQKLDLNLYIVKENLDTIFGREWLYKINPNLEVPQHPLPKLEEIFSCLNGGKHFSKLDISHAYL